MPRSRSSSGRWALCSHCPRRVRTSAIARQRWLPLRVMAEKCNGCTMCLRIGCPAILKSDELDEKTQRPKALIDPLLCTGCEVCAQVCPVEAILFRDQIELTATIGWTR